MPVFINNGASKQLTDHILDSTRHITSTDRTILTNAKDNILYYGLSTTSTINNYLLSISSNVTSYFNGLGISIMINAVNTGNSTININSLGIKKLLDGSGKELLANSLLVNSIYTFRYNGTNFIMQGGLGQLPWAVSATEPLNPPVNFMWIDIDKKLIKIRNVSGTWDNMGAVYL